jgi:DNA-nicking Smr family endonuclease
MPDDDDVVVFPIDGTLDLHTFHPRDARAVVDDYVTAAREAGLVEIRIIHGRGTGVLRGLVQAALEAHPDVEAFDDDHASHLGATIARLVTHQRE